MDNINKAPGGTPVRHKLKKVKRPIKRPVSTPETLSVPPKTTEFAAPRPDQSIAPAMTSSAAAEEHQAPMPEKMDAFSLDAFLDGDNLPAIQQDTRLQQNNFERGFIRDEDINPTPPSWKDRMVVGDLYTGFAVFVTAAVFLLFGIMFAKIFLSGPTTVQNGLQGVVINSEVPRGRARCGVAEKDPEQARQALQQAVKNWDETSSAQAAGDLLFAAANAMRLAGVDAEEALTFAAKRFTRRLEADET